MQTVNPKILIIDDKPENLTLFRDILRPYNYDLSVATNGVTALKIVKDFHPELILLDVVMPQMSGYDVLKELKNNKSTREIPVIFLTAKDTTEEKVKGFEAGAVDYIAKPFHPRELIARIHTHLQKASLLASLKRLMEHSFHELYTPLSIISSAMEIQELAYEKTEYTQMTLAACKSLQSIYDDLYYSINYINDEKEKSLFDLTALLVKRISYFSLVAQSRSLTFETDLHQESIVFLNEKEIERVFDNLISNALKYTKEHEKITITIQENDKNWIFSICNPVDKEIDVAKIFQKYYRHDNEEVFGLGLGLDLVQSICRQNDIKIGAQVDDRLFCIKMEISKIK
ncbi:MAG: hybrid sensor histidine kinase/response regulator [Thiovulaceae bacterium]|nr:hybrid sensor histidine kinase/response regulator [Sulfurimonadaceae bacterium]